LKYLLLFVLLTVSIAGFCEVRSMWVLPWDITTPESIDSMIQTALDSNQNELLVEVRYRSDALYDTAKAGELFPNPEPRSYILADNGFDPLSYTLSKAHAVGLKVQAWVIVFNATPLDSKLIAKNYVYNNHRDWLTCDKAGNTLNGNIQFGYFVDAGVPEVQDHLISVFSNLVAGYPELDGLHLDYIRYPDIRLGYHPVSVQRYNEYCAEQGEITFNEWRIMQVSSFVQKVRDQVKMINPKLMLSAAVFADIAEANVSYAQDWTSWLKLGLVDRIYPMAYNKDFKVYQKQLVHMKLLGKDDAIVLGLRAWDEGGKSLVATGRNTYDVLDIAKRVDYTRLQGFGGVAMFSYAGLKVGNAWKQLTRMCFSDASSLSSASQYSSVQAAEIPPDAMQAEKLSSNNAEFKVHAEKNEYVIDLSIPSEGRWRWEVYRDEMIYYRYRYYLEGQNRDFWNGALDSRGEPAGDNLIAPGEYTVRLLLDGTSQSYSFPVIFEALETP